MTALDLVEEYLAADNAGAVLVAGMTLGRRELLAAVRFARGRAEAPPWWAEVVHELRAQRREDREEVEA